MTVGESIVAQPKPSGNDHFIMGGGLKDFFSSLFFHMMLKLDFFTHHLKLDFFSEKIEGQIFS